ncbi:MAG: hypothetical protein PHQ03_07725 [Methylococcales bacterium]|nr:hypothetical protein [Methylococcales bacterium]
MSSIRSMFESKTIPVLPFVILTISAPALPIIIANGQWIIFV